MQTHRVKSWPHLFHAVVEGVKLHELRRNDRGYQIGDILLLEEYVPETTQYTGRSFQVRITYVTSPSVPCAVSSEALHSDFCILSIEPTTL